MLEYDGVRVYDLQMKEKLQKNIIVRVKSATSKNIKASINQKVNILVKLSPKCDLC